MLICRRVCPVLVSGGHNCSSQRFHWVCPGWRISWQIMFSLFWRQFLASCPQVRDMIFMRSLNEHDSCLGPLLSRPGALGSSFAMCRVLSHMPNSNRSFMHLQPALSIAFSSHFAAQDGRVVAARKRKQENPHHIDVSNTLIICLGHNRCLSLAMWTSHKLVSGLQQHHKDGILLCCSLERSLEGDIVARLACHPCDMDVQTVTQKMVVWASSMLNETHQVRQRHLVKKTEQHSWKSPRETSSSPQPQPLNACREWRHWHHLQHLLTIYTHQSHSVGAKLATMLQTPHGQ